MPEAGTLSAGFAKIDTTEVSPEQLSVIEAGAVQDTAGERGAGEASLTQVGARKVRARKIRAGQVQSAEIYTQKPRILELQCSGSRRLTGIALPAQLIQRSRSLGLLLGHPFPSRDTAGL